ncbi:uncharacterized protein [Spinacia oleracea]|uniref:SHSP domain-containing protein n=1 Tax=Spinacia oleracea TaxID=3562 RepID=A0A9R0JSZ7_SPIOL|nr:uncharacterized protein LOC110785317 [Spinacia oleracea]
MAIKTKTSSTPAPPSYVDFDPACDLKKEQGHETLTIHLPDFKKNQIRVQVNKDGVLRVSGERPTSEDGTKRCRFVKETKIPNDSDVNLIQAKFTDGRLHVTMSKKVTPSTPQVIQEKPTLTPSPSPPPPQPVVTDQKPKAEAGDLISDDQTPKGTDHENGIDQPKGDHVFEHESIIQRLHLQGRKVVALGFGVAVVTMAVAIGAFVAS